MIAKRYVREYAKDLTEKAGPCFTLEIQSILRQCERGYITSQEAVRLMAREDQNRMGLTDEEYRTFKES